MDNLQDLPEAQRIDYAPAQPKRRFPLMLLCATPFIASGTATLVGTAAMLTGMDEDPGIACAIGVGLLVFGGMLILVHLRWR